MVSARTASSRASLSLNRSRARTMRHMPSDAEKKFWWLVRDCRLAGHKFKRQFLIGRYIVDFVCLDRRLIVELDGGQHARQDGYDRERDSFLRTKGFQVLRFWNTDFLTNTDGVIDIILAALASPPHPGPLPLKGARER